jgi:hypothetical protein
VNVCSPAYSRSVYVARVHVHGVHQAVTVFLVYAMLLRCAVYGTGVTVSGYNGLISSAEARGGTMSGGQKKGGTGGREAVPVWEYVEVLSGEGAKTHWQCVFLGRRHVPRGALFRRSGR